VELSAFLFTAEKIDWSQYENNLSEFFQKVFRCANCANYAFLYFISLFYPTCDPFGLVGVAIVPTVQTVPFFTVFFCFGVDFYKKLCYYSQ